MKGENAGDYYTSSDVTIFEDLQEIDELTFFDTPQGGRFVEVDRQE